MQPTIENDIGENVQVNNTMTLKENNNQEEIQNNNNEEQRSRNRVNSIKENSVDLNNNVLEVNETDRNQIINETLKKDNFAENNISIRNIIDNALFSQLSEINIKLLDLEENVSERIYNSKGKIIPKIDFIEFTLLNQNVNISELKKYGFGLYVFFLYLKSLLVTFGILFIFVFHYTYCLFFKYYRDYKEEYSLFFDYNILSLVSGVQIIRFRKYFIEKYGKEAFLEKCKDFDVIYKEYLFTGTIVFIIAFLSNFIFLLYLMKTYKIFRIENPEIKNYTLILSGKDAPKINSQQDNEENETINDKKTAMKNQLMNLLNVKDVDINFTFKLFKYYEKMEEMNSLKKDNYKLQYRINRNKCCCYGCCCFCGFCFCCCCSKKSLDARQKNINDQIEELKKEMNEIKSKELYNPLYIITFHNKEDYDRIYSEYPHSYIKYLIKKCFKKNNSFYVNKAPSPEDLVWKNLEFDKEYRYFKSKIENFLISMIYVVISFIIQIFGELIDEGSKDNIKFLFVVNIIVSYFLGLLDSRFSSRINSLLVNNSNSWSYSDIKFYSIIFQTIFKFINQGLFPFLTYLWISKDDNYSNLVSKMFVLIEMDGFGYPMIDWLYNVVLTKGRDMYESTKKIMSLENVEKEISDQVVNKEGLSRLELEQTYEKKEMDLEGNYSDILAIYWITMFYLSIYPIGVIQSFLNLLFKYIIEKNFLLNVYKRPEYINPQFGFLCFNFFNFGFFLFLCGDIIFFRNEDNKKSFGAGYIVIMLLFLLIPFYLLAKLIMYITNNCCLKKDDSKNLDEIKRDIKTDYRLFNPCYQKEEITKIFSEWEKENLLTSSQYDELIEKLNRLNDLDLYKIQQSLRIPKVMKFEERHLTTSFLYDNSSVVVDDKDKEKLYYFLMQLGFISYLEEGNVLKPNKKPFQFEEGLDIRSLALNCLSMQENLSNSDSGYFTIFKEKNELIMPYVDCESNIKIFDVFHRRVLNDVKDLKYSKKIVCVDYFSIITPYGEIRYLISIALDNTMIISNLLINEKNTNIIVNDIGDTFKENENKPNSTFCLSTTRHQEGMWIITSYYYDKMFKIYNPSGNCLHKVENRGEYIISLEGLFYTEENTYICVRTPSSINLFINEFYIRQIRDMKEYSYINFKITRPFDYFTQNIYIIITVINKDLTSYGVYIIDIFPIFPLFTRLFNFLVQVTFGSSINQEVHVPMNSRMQEKLSKNAPKIISEFNIRLNADWEQIMKQKKFFESSEIDKFNIGNILLWDNEYLIIGTPFNYLDILDYKNKVKVGVINNTESIRSLDNYGLNKEISDIITYNISEQIDDPEYGSCFIMRDNKGKIQYIRPAKIKDKLNYRLIKSDEYFNDMEDGVKLERILFSTRFYFLYCLISYLLPLITSIVGHNKNKDWDYSIYLFTTSFWFYLVYIFFGIWFKGCVSDITDDYHTKRTCTKAMGLISLAFKVCANSMASYSFCLENKRGIVFIGILFGIYFIHWNLKFIIYICKVKFLLRTYWLGFLFYQISRFCILLFFIISIVLKMDHIETYIYAIIFCIIFIYMYMSNYYNTLMKEITYNSYIQSVFNYPFEWMNLCCCCCTDPKECIKNIDRTCCVCDSFFLALFQYLIMFILVCIYVVFQIIKCICTLFCGDSS